MALQPNIALQVQRPEFEDPISSFAKVAQVRNMLTQGQLHQQQIATQQEALKTHQLANAETERAQQDDANFQRIYRENGGDLQKSIVAARDSGVRPGYLNKHIDEFNKQVEQTAKTDKEKTAAATAKLDFVYERLKPLETVQDPIQQSALWDGAMADLVKAGQLTPEEVHPYPGPDGVQNELMRFTTQKQILTAAEEKRKQAEENRKATEFPVTLETKQEDLATKKVDLATKERQDAAAKLGAATNAAEYGAVLNELPHRLAVMFPPAEQFDAKNTPAIVRQRGMTAEQQTQAGQAATNASNTARHEKIEEGLSGGRLRVEQANSARAQKQFDATYGALLDADGKPLAPDAAKAVAMQDPAAVAVANYQTAPPTMSRGGPGAAILRKVMAINPQYDAKNWTNQGKVLTDFSAGTSAKELGAASVALGHLGVMKEAIAALNNSDVRVLNSVANRLGLETGSSPAAVFRTIVHRVGPELTKAYVAAGGGQGERGTTEADFDPNLGPKVLNDNISVSAKLLDGKIDQKKQQWKNVMGDRAFPGLTQAAEEARKSIGGGAATAGAIKVTVPGGKTFTFPTQEKADAFKKSAGIQ